MDDLTKCLYKVVLRLNFGKWVMILRTNGAFPLFARLPTYHASFGSLALRTPYLLRLPSHPTVASNAVAVALTSYRFSVRVSFNSSEMFACRANKNDVCQRRYASGIF